MFCFRIEKKKGPCNEGFTLVELILVTCLLVIVGGVIYSAFSQGAKLWHYAQTSKPSIDLDLICDKMKVELHNALLDSDKPFAGREDGFQFFLMATGPSEDTQKKIFGDQMRPVRLRYYYDKGTAQIVRAKEEYTELLSTELHKKQPASKVIFQGVRDCKFSYYVGQNQRGEHIWRKNWDEQCLPQAVRMTIESALAGKDQSWDQIMSIRSGTCTTEKTSG
jgi:hypothetical protein